jgi:hypothetical protein
LLNTGLSRAVASLARRRRRLHVQIAADGASRDPDPPRDLSPADPLLGRCQFVDQLDSLPPALKLFRVRPPNTDRRGAARILDRDDAVDRLMTYVETPADLGLAHPSLNKC